MGKPITDKRIIDEIRDAHQVTQLCLEPTTPGFEERLRKSRIFTNRVHGLVSKKIAAIENEEITYTTGRARAQALESWEKLLAKCDEFRAIHQEKYWSR